MRKLNSGVPAKILIGRGGPNVVIQGNHYINGNGSVGTEPQVHQTQNNLNNNIDLQNRRTLNNFQQNKQQNLIQSNQMRHS